MATRCRSKKLSISSLCLVISSPPEHFTWASLGACLLEIFCTKQFKRVTFTWVLYMLLTLHIIDRQKHGLRSPNKRERLEMTRNDVNISIKDQKQTSFTINSTSFEWLLTCLHKPQQFLSCSSDAVIFLSTQAVQRARQARLGGAVKVTSKIVWNTKQTWLIR